MVSAIDPLAVILSQSFIPTSNFTDQLLCAPFPLTHRVFAAIVPFVWNVFLLYV